MWLARGTHKHKNAEKQKVRVWKKIHQSYQTKGKLVIQYQTKQTKPKKYDSLSSYNNFIFVCTQQSL